MAELADAHGSGYTTSVNLQNHVFYLQKLNMRIWRNWQTRMVQVHVKAISCRFKSCYPHQKKPDFIGLLCYICIKIK